MTWVRFCGLGGRAAAGYGRQDACRYRSGAVPGGFGIGKIVADNVRAGAATFAGFVHRARAGMRDYFEDEVLAAGEFVSALGRTSEAFTCRIFLSRVTIVLSSPTDAATRPSSTCPSASRITSG